MSDDLDNLRKLIAAKRDSLWVQSDSWSSVKEIALGQVTPEYEVLEVPIKTNSMIIFARLKKVKKGKKIASKKKSFFFLKTLTHL